MIASQMNLTETQVESFDQFMLDGTGRTLDALICRAASCC
jgi:hypothetical protein